MKIFFYSIPWCMATIEMGWDDKPTIGGILDSSDGKEYEYSTASFAKAGEVLLANDAARQC